MRVEPEDAEPAVVMLIEPGDDSEFSSAIRTEIVNWRRCLGQDIREHSCVGENDAQVSHAVMNLIVTGEWCRHLHGVGNQPTQSRYGIGKPITARSTAVVRIEEDHLRIVTHSVVATRQTACNAAVPPIFVLNSVDSIDEEDPLATGLAAWGPLFMLSL